MTPPKNIHKIFLSKNYSFFWNPPKILILKILNPKKWPEPTYVWKYQSTPPLLGMYIEIMPETYMRLHLEAYMRMPFHENEQKNMGRVVLWIWAELSYNLGGVGKGWFCMWDELAWAEFVLGWVVCNSSSICSRSMNFAGGLHDFLHNSTVPA